MKKITRLLSLILALALAVVSVSVTAIAEVTHNGSSSITISGVPTDNAGYFKVYQIFDGDTSDDNDGVLSNIEWGSSLTTTGQTALIDAINDYVGSTVLDSDATAKEVAAALKTYVTVEEDLRTIMMGIFSNSSNIVADQQTAGISGISWSVTDDGGTYTHSATIDDGYYFIVGTYQGVAQDTIVVAVVGDTVASNKTVNAVTISKDVDNNNYAYGVGEEVTFNVNVTLPSTLSAYSEYVIKIEDTLSGLTIDDQDLTNAVSVKMTDSSGNTAALSNITPDLNSGVLTFTLTLNSGNYDFAAYAGGYVTFTYTAEVTDEGYETSYNTVKATYSSDPTDSTQTITTSEEKVQLYTVSIKVKKTDGTDPLEGAFFTLTDNDSGDVIDTRTSNSDADDSNIIDAVSSGITTFYFVGLGEGTYTLNEKTTPSGYNTTGDYTIVVNSNGSVEVTDADGNTDDSYTVSYLENLPTAGEVEFTVVNNAGSTLPETGGMGTKIFYTLGGALVVCAGVLLIVKRRMRNA
ncbi:MAG: isopeptide-forming domain-containing fimbrial protein [Clostridiales bacterium]|nr:isopeptide-forming domain-containing fimbrial protein [Clostridiales bacterium]